MIDKLNKKEEFKKHKENIIPALILILVSSFMTFIYEPVIFYSSNTNDLWFNFKLLLPCILLYFILMITGLILFYTIVYYICSKLLKKERAYKIILLISFIIFLFTYIQGNYLVGTLPILDGTTIEWDSYKIENLISISIFIILIVAELLFLKKFKLNKTININKYITLSVFVMLFVPLLTNIFNSNSNIYKDKKIPTNISTYENINNSSSDRNFYIILTDAVDSIEFSKVLEESQQYKSTFNDFTYYPDTVSTYTATRDSVPFIFSGIWNKNEKQFSEYYTEAFEKSELLNKLKEENYDLNFYTEDMINSIDDSNIFSNFKTDEISINKFILFREYTQYFAFRYLPFPLKRYSRIEGINFNTCRKNKEKSYCWQNQDVYNIIKDTVNIVDNKHFQYLHLEGGHKPYNYDDDLNTIGLNQGTYKQKLKSTLKLINSFIQKLRDNNVYDNSVIIVIADHGDQEDRK